jgi:hypothetical protein
MVCVNTGDNDILRCWGDQAQLRKTRQSYTEIGVSGEQLDSSYLDVERALPNRLSRLRRGKVLTRQGTEDSPGLAFLLAGII